MYNPGTDTRVSQNGGLRDPKGCGIRRGLWRGVLIIGIFMVSNSRYLGLNRGLKGLGLKSRISGLVLKTKKNTSSVHPYFGWTHDFLPRPQLKPIPVPVAYDPKP